MSAFSESYLQSMRDHVDGKRSRGRIQTAIRVEKFNNQGFYYLCDGACNICGPAGSLNFMSKSRAIELRDHLNDYLGFKRVAA